MIRRAGAAGLRLLQPLWRATRGVTLGVRALVVDGEGRVLLVEHTYAPGWHLPGGGVERGETALAAVKRELAEEAAIAAGAPELFGLYANFANMPRDHVAVFLVREWRALDRPRPRIEIAGTGFFARNALPPGTTFGTHRRIAELFERRQKAAEW